MVNEVLLMRIESDLKLDFDDVLLRPKRSKLVSREEVDLYRTFKFFPDKVVNFYYGIPIMASNMDGVGTFGMAKALGDHGLFTCLKKSYSVDEIVNFYTEREEKRIVVEIGFRVNYTVVSLGISEKDLEKFRKIYLKCKKFKVTVRYACIDVANGYSESFIGFIKNLREEFPGLIIIAGNVVTPEQTEQLILSGANVVKVGIGPGSCCTTRIQTGVGYPQLSAIMECADAAHGLGGYIIADGGCKNPGDVVKAFAAGADFVMLGGMFAGHAERLDSPGEEALFFVRKVITRFWNNIRQTPKLEIEKYVKFYGMSSTEANKKHSGGMMDYRSSEGRIVEVPYKGEVKGTVQNILGGIRSACTYVGARTLKDLSKCATFVRCNNTHNEIYSNKTIGY
jgi:GMP reductase